MLVLSQDLHPGVAAQARVELSVAHVHGHHRRRAPTEKAVGEAARRRAGVETTPVGHDNGETLESGLQLVAAARDETTTVFVDDDGIVLGHQSRGLVGHGPADEDGTAGDDVVSVGS